MATRVRAPLKNPPQETNKRMKNKYGMLLILISACLWGTAGIFVRGMQGNNVGEMQIVLARALFSSLILGVVILFKDKTLFKIRLKDIWIFACTGIFSIVMFNFCYYKTMELSTLSIAAVLLYTAPFFVAAMSAVIFKERLTLQKCIACACAFVGCCFVSGAFSSAQKISGECLIYGLLTGFGYSLYTIFGNILLKRGYNSITITFYTFVFALLGCVFFVEPVDTVSVLINGKMLIIAVLMALTNTAIPYICYTNGLKTVEPSRAPIIATVEPVMATVVGVIVYNEKLTLHGVIGILLVLGSVMILNIERDKDGN